MLFRGFAHTNLRSMKNNMHLLSLISLSVLLLWTVPVFSQSLTINELMASNATTIADEDGDFEDWIEIYNFGSDPINLEGYGLSDNYNNPFKWVFPDYTIMPGHYLLVWASGKDRKLNQGSLANGILRKVYEGIPGAAVADLTNHPSYPDDPSHVHILHDLFEAPTNVGDHYGQLMHGWIKAPVTGNYFFWIASDDNSHLYLSASANPADAVLIAQVPGWTGPREWNKYSHQQSAAVFLQEGEYYYVKALMKEHEGGDNLAVGWQIPDVGLQRPIPVQHLFTDVMELHTNFSISAAGEEVLLTHPSGALIDEIQSIAIPTDISYGHSPDGSGTLVFFNEPTPGQSNTTQGYSTILEPPVFSHTEGFFTQDFELSITHPDPDITIIYTLDGSIPDETNLSGKTYQYKNSYSQSPWNPPGPFLTNTFQSHQYSSPLAIVNRSSQADKLTQISSTWNFNPGYFPGSPVSKGTVVRAIAVKEDALPGPVITNTYFVFPEGRDKYSLPVVSINLNEDAFFDYQQGIYVAGVDFDNWRAANPAGWPDGGTPANYWRRGDDTESPAHIELFPPGSDQTALNVDFGVRIHGGWSRSFRQKSLRLYARNRYGGDYFNYAFFPDNPHDSFRRLMLRNSGNDADVTLFRDAAIQKICEGLDFDVQDYQPAILFINAEYWGINNFRERYDKHYLARVYGVDPENLDILDGNATVKEGDAAHYNAMRNYMNSNNMSLPEHYEYIKTQMDVSNFIDYNIAQIFVSNTDWPGNNIDYWRLRTSGYIPEAPTGHDGRWRWLMYDTDFGLGLYGGSVSHNTLVFATAPNGPSWPNPPWSTFLLRTLLTNPEFEHAFIVRFADLLNTTFLSGRMVEIINNMKQALTPEMPAHMQRWKAPSTMSTWNNNVNVMISFANQRTVFQRQHIRQYFEISADVDVELDVSHAEQGYIRINTINITSETHGIPEQLYPWTGIYYTGIPIEVEAIALPGYAFSHWEGSSNNDEALITIIPEGNINLTAHFVDSTTPDPEIIHYWHFNDLPSGTLTQVESDYTFAGVSAGQIAYPGTGDGYIDRRTHRAEDPVSNLNLLMGQLPDQGAVLRARNPSDTRELIIEAATTGFENIQVAFATTRTNNGATTQQFYYSPDGGQTWEAHGSIYFPPLLPVWELKTFDLSGIAEANNNPALQYRILFGGDNAGGSSGNNRFDNFSLCGHTMEGFLPGDANGDGALNILDVVTIAGYIMGQNPEPFIFENADVNGDGIINILDMVETANIILGEGLSRIEDFR
jgi:hypothetical protein